jgi:hypothetical protein
MIGEVYKCILDNGYNFKVGQTYKVIRESAVYLPQYESPEEVPVIVFEMDMWIPKYDFHIYFKNVDYIRDEKINLILKK